MKRAVKAIIKKMGYEVRALPGLQQPQGALSDDAVYTTLLPHRRIADVDRLATIADSIPGMINPNNGRILYSLAALQSETGDVVEIGSWQGRSTSFLARAVKESRNGRFYAIDHFKGNVGKEHFYVVGKKDLSDLEAGFRANMRRIGLEKDVTLLNSTVSEAEKELANSSIRFLFIDGDHTEAGVRRDLELFYPKLVPNAIVAFDDFSSGFPGVLKVVDEYFEKGLFSLRMSYANTLIARR